eukprot:1158011-Pelagomonas_calceolata.AAC.6
MACKVNTGSAPCFLDLQGIENAFMHTQEVRMEGKKLVIYLWKPGLAVCINKGSSTSELARASPKRLTGLD